MGKFSQRYGVDKDRAENGVTVDFGDGVKVTLRRSSSKHSRDVREKLERPYTNMTRTGRPLPADIQEKLNKAHLIEGIIIDWEGVELNDQLVSFNKENALAVFEAYPDFLNDVLVACTTQDAFRKEEREQDVKN